MSRRVKRQFISQPEPPRVCELCGRVAELRPYGPNGENICFACGMKDEESCKRQFMKVLEMVDVVVADPGGMIKDS